MAEDAQDRTEMPTARRLNEARDKGQVAYSNEMTRAFIFLAALVVLKSVGGDVVGKLGELLKRSLELPTGSFEAGSPEQSGFIAACRDAMLTAAPFLAMGVIATLIPGIAQLGLHFKTQALAFNIGRINPITGIGNVFNTMKLVAIAIDLAKFSVVGCVLWFAIEAAWPRLLGLGGCAWPELVELFAELLFVLGWRVAAGLLILGLIDLIYKRKRHIKNLMMTKEEIKEESKQLNGNPQIKDRIKTVQRELFFQRMKSDVKGAHLVVRNPTHFAVALRYDGEKEPAPRVVAKGRALMALQIIKIAEEAGVTVIENRPLARELYRTVRLGDVVPEKLFRAVAELLAVVFRKRRSMKAGA